MNFINSDLVKGHKVIVKKEGLKICPKCGRLTDNGNFCIHCPGVPLLDVEFQ